ncbi:oligoribonuclease [Phanerochaete sordida]|uniref:Oligoribonuclease n=1 Tax=Phanerochaete sordida TaxID=48140 RepID=A0A9P3G3Y0_9APHY|nr:oligoribonuclease [Phanerochaete sordida]
MLNAPAVHPAAPANQNQPLGPYDSWKSPIVWIDLETTGIDVFGDTILEIAVIITDKYLRKAHAGIHYVIKTDEETLEKMVPDCVEMHTKSGLYQECLQSTYTKDFVYSKVLSYIKKYVPLAHRAVIGGSSVQFDKIFLLREMPEIVKHLKYQVLDVSSIMYEARAIFPEDVQPRKPLGKHRALADIENSIAQLKWYRAHLYKTPDEARASVEAARGATRTAPLQATASLPTPPPEQGAAGPSRPINGQGSSRGMQRAPSGGAGHRMAPY